MQPKVILVVLDGWGYSQNKKGNSILQANKPNFDRFWQQYPHTLLSASGEEVGLPWGAIGSSEVGHLTIGSGRVIYQELPRVTRAIKDKSFYKNPVLLQAIEHAEQHHSSLHLVGLVSAGGVHSHIDHLKALLELIKKRRFPGSSYIHMFTDGRDTSPNSSPLYLEKIKEHIRHLRLPTRIASITGRFFSMDRDNHWDRTLSAYENLVDAKGQTYNSPEQAIDSAYGRSETDEFIQPSTIIGPPSTSFLSRLLSKKGPASPSKPIGPIQDNDAVIFFNFRPDRIRQLVELFLFPRPDTPNKTMRRNLYIATMTQYNEGLPVKVALPPEHISNPLAKILSERNLTQLHIAETEKYAHVTYFFNGGNPQPHQGEKWYLVPSPKVATYDLKPQMSAAGIVDYAIRSHSQTPFDFILINFANADMVGHSGKLQPTIEAIETIDKQLGRLRQAFPESFFIITADHGNAEVMLNAETGKADTEHSLNPVPCLIIHDSLRLTTSAPEPNQPTGILADITPTILYIYNIAKSPEITGYNLLESLAPHAVAASSRLANTKS